MGSISLCPMSLHITYYGSVCSKNSYERKSCNHTHSNDLSERILDVVKTKRKVQPKNGHHFKKIVIVRGRR